MTLAELRALLKKKVAEMKALVAAHPETMDDDTTTKFDGLKKDVDGIKANIDRLVALEGLDKEVNDGQGRQTAADRRTPATAKKPEDETRGFESISDFAICVRAVGVDGVVDDRLKFLGAPSNPHREGNSNDGFEVPPAYASSIYELMFQEPDLLSMVDDEPTSSNRVVMLADETTPWGSAGIQASFIGEGKKMTPSRLETKGKGVDLHKLFAFVEVTDELLEDAPRMNSRLTRGAARAMAWKGNWSILDGNGVGMPLGFRNSASAIVVAKETGQAAATIVAKNIAKMYARSANPGGSVWLANQDILPELITLTLNDKPIWTPPSEGFKQAPGGLLLGRPMMFTDHNETLGAQGDLSFVDPKGYFSPRKRTIKSSSSMHLYFDYDMQVFKWTFRLGGAPYLNKVITPNKGSNTRSHYIELAVRE